jgi:hypothetical protein
MDGYRFARLRGYREVVSFALEWGDGPLLRETRQRLSTLSLDADELDELANIDADVVDEVMLSDHIEPDVLKDDDHQPLEHWWWHLGKLRQRTFPAARLPEHLRAVYLEGLSQAA